MPIAATCRSPKSGAIPVDRPHRRGKEGRDAGIGRDAGSLRIEYLVGDLAELRVAHCTAACLAIFGPQSIQVLLEVHLQTLYARRVEGVRAGISSIRKPRRNLRDLGRRPTLANATRRKPSCARAEIGSGQAEHAALRREPCADVGDRSRRRKDAQHRRNRRRSSRSTSRRGRDRSPERRGPAADLLAIRRAPIRQARRSPRSARAAARAARRSAAYRGSSRSPR